MSIKGKVLKSLDTCSVAGKEVDVIAGMRRNNIKRVGEQLR